MEKPMMKREVAVYSHDGHGVITFYATNDAVSEFAEFGSITAFQSLRGGFCLRVDPRYDFDEVLAYISNYGSEL